MQHTEQNENAFSQEAACQPGGNYGLCRTHPTCEMIHRRLQRAEAKVDALRRKVLFLGTFTAVCGVAALGALVATVAMLWK